MPCFLGPLLGYTQACTALGLDPAEGGLGAPFGGPLAKVGLLPTRRQLPQLQGPWRPGSGSTDVCVFVRILRTNKCQGKSEGKRFHPPPALNDIIASKSGCLTRTLLLTWGGGRPLRPTVSALRAGAGGGRTCFLMSQQHPGAEEEPGEPFAPDFLLRHTGKALKHKIKHLSWPGKPGAYGTGSGPSEQGWVQAGM